MTISDKAMLGKNDFLFLNGRDSNNLLGHLAGQIPLKNATHTIHKHNKKIIDGLGVPFLGIIVPEAHCIYPEHLPNGISISENRPVREVIGDMAKGYFYPLEHLLAYKAQGGTVYTGRDSHWTQPAALECYQALRGSIGRTHLMSLAYQPSLDAETGDLSAQSHKIVIQNERKLIAQIKTSYINVFASRILNHGNVIVTYNPAGKGRCLAFGTSFSTRLVPAYASDFEEVVFCYGTTADPAIVKLVQPDCVICELPERFLHFPTYSVAGSTLISLLLGLHDHKGTSTAQLKAGAPVSDKVAALGEIFAGINARAMGQPARKLMTHLERVDQSLARRIALLAPFLKEPMEKRALRLLLSGQFYNKALLAQVSKHVDDGLLDIGRVALVPDSEAGLLTQIRIFLRADLEVHARQALDKLQDQFDTSPEAAYYENKLRTVKEHLKNLPFST
tara:strand:+ start:4126 stop:5469 length:1344 start_codon:yes stop_codon:yes gene_type:complete